MKPKQLLHAISIAHERATEMAQRSVVHGPRHWRDVARVGHLLIKQGAKADPAVVLLFAALHDTQRRTEGPDPEHGERAATVAAELRSTFKLSKPQWRLLRQALIEHDCGLTSDDPTIGACWDADRLTLPRLCIRVRRSLLSTEIASGCIREAVSEITRRPDVTWADVIAGRGPKPHKGPFTLYQGTRAGLEDAIRSSGLREPGFKCGIYLTPDRRMANQYAAAITGDWTMRRHTEYMVDLLAMDKKWRSGHALTEDEDARLRSGIPRLKALKAECNQPGIVVTVKLPASWGFAFTDHDYYGYVTPAPCIDAKYIVSVEPSKLDRSNLIALRLNNATAPTIAKVLRDREQLMTVLDDSNVLVNLTEANYRGFL